MRDSLDAFAFDLVASAAWRRNGRTPERPRDNVWSTAVNRALHGVKIPYFYCGKQRGAHRNHNDRLLIAALRAADRAAGRGAPDA